MAGSTLGEAFRVTNWGESHGPAIGVVIDGCPAGIEITPEMIQIELDRRRPGQSDYTTPRNESDLVEIQSGVYNGVSDGTPISLRIPNRDHHSDDYDEMVEAYRPSHAGFAYDAKFGLYNPLGGGRSSARMTAGTVAAGAIARKIIKDIAITAYVTRVKNVDAPQIGDVSREDVDASPVRCPDHEASEQMMQVIAQAKETEDSVGGIIQCVVTGVPAGLGEPVYDKLEADLAGAMVGINAVKGFDLGSGFAGTRLYGSENNDPFVIEDGKVVTTTNNSGGIQGGISNGMPIVFRVAFKPTATINREQKTVTRDGKETVIVGKGRHDPCVLPRAVPIVEAYTACVLADHFLRARMNRK